MLATTSQAVLTRLRAVPTRAAPAFFTFGSMLGVPAILIAFAATFFAIEIPALGGIALLLSAAAFVGAVIIVWVLLLQASGRLQRAEQALYAGDLETATREGLFVTKTVFRSDYQTGALFTLALVAERIGAFAEAGALFTRAIDMIPAMAAQRNGRRARALFAAHAAIAFAASGDPQRAHAMLASCFQALGQAGQPGAFDALLDDSYMGSLGVNAILRTLENKREPRPLAVLASMLVAFKDGQPQAVLQSFASEQYAIQQGLAPHERALAERLHAEAFRLSTNAGPHRSPGALAPATEASSWAMLVLR